MNKYYIYFIQIDEKYIKFGITNNANRRLKEHYKKFVLSLGLIEYFKIIKIIVLDTLICNTEAEKRLKKYIKISNNFIIKYNETEILELDKLNMVNKKMDLFINNIIDEYEIDDQYRELSDEEIDLIFEDLKKTKINKKKCNEKYDDIKLDNKVIDLNIPIDNSISVISNTPYISDYIRNDIKSNIKTDIKKNDSEIARINIIKIYGDKYENKNNKICPRCGKIYHKIIRHLNSIKECKPIFLDIDRKLIINNYTMYLDQFKNFINKYNRDGKYNCQYCEKLFDKKYNRDRHEKNNCKNNMTHILIHDENNDNITTIDSSDIIINNFGKEIELSDDNILAIINNCLVNEKYDEIIPNYVKNKWIDKAENRNFKIIDANRGIAKIYNGKWERQILNEYIDIIHNNAIKNIKKCLNDNIYEDLDIINEIIEYLDNSENNKTIKRNINIKIKNYFIDHKKNNS